MTAGTKRLCLLEIWSPPVNVVGQYSFGSQKTTLPGIRSSTTPFASALFRHILAFYVFHGLIPGYNSLRSHSFPIRKSTQ